MKGGEEGGQKLFIGRAHHQNSLTPGKVPERDKICVLPWGTISNTHDDFELLIFPGEASWVHCESGNVPQNGFPCGNSEQGETLYIGRVLHEGALIVGKVQPSHRVCYIAFGPREASFRKYEVLVV